MGLEKNTVPAGTRRKQLLQSAGHKDDKGALMPILQKAQEIYGYLLLKYRP